MGSIYADRSSDPSLSIATLPGKAVAMSYGTKLIIARFPLSEDSTPSPLNSMMVDDGQLVRAVAFLEIPDGPTCLVSAGDSKYINVYNVSSWREDDPNSICADGDDEEAALKKLTVAQTWKPSYRYGPHSKRITSITTCDEGTIVFADKFGEVYQLNLCWSPEHTIEVNGDTKAPAEFLLQHFSIISALKLSSSVPRLERIGASQERTAVECRRLFTCDKDRHTRVSRFPETCIIEQYLWTKNPQQSVVTCVAEIPYMEELNEFRQESAVNKQNKAHNAPFCYYATGDFDGQVTFWAARNDIPADSTEPSFLLLATYKLPAAADGAGAGPVVSITYVAATTDENDVKLHPRDSPRGVFIAFQNSTEIVFIPIFDGSGKYQISIGVIAGASVHIDERPAAMAPCSESTAVVLDRSGSLSFVRLIAFGAEEMDRHGTTQQGAKMGVVTVDQKMPFLEERVKAVMCTKEKEGAVTLEDLDLCAQWQYEAVDPRSRRDAEVEDEDDGEEGPETEEAKVPNKKKRKVK